MSNPIETNATPTGEFQSHFGGPPGSSDAAAECKKWEKLCGELLAERQKLREELAHSEWERQALRKTVFHFMCKDYVPPPFTKEELLAFVDKSPPLEDFIAELEREMRSGA